MNILSKISIATAFIACISFNTSAANDSQSNALLSIVKNSVHQAVTQANESIDLGLQKSILTNVHNLSTGNEEAPIGQVKIIDLASTAQSDHKEVSEKNDSTKAD